MVDQFGAGHAAPVGLHGHDNQGFALHNTLAAAQAGATWVDSTVLGMGRGAGNARTEQLLAALGTDQQTLQPLLDLVARRFEPLMHKYRWGSSVRYAIAGMRRIHPTYVQRLRRAWSGTSRSNCAPWTPSLRTGRRRSPRRRWRTRSAMPLSDHVGERLEQALAADRLVVFDLDGVVVDSNELKVECMREALAEFGTELVDPYIHEFRRTFGRTRREHFLSFHRYHLGGEEAMGEI